MPRSDDRDSILADLDEDLRGCQYVKCLIESKITMYTPVAEGVPPYLQYTETRPENWPICENREVVSWMEGVGNMWVSKVAG